jgi:hypothetical protein
MKSSEPTECFFCGKKIYHVNEEGEGWLFNVNVAPGKHVSAMYCEDECTGLFKTEDSDNAREHLIWRQNAEGRSGGYYEIIGPEGFDGITPETTDYDD